MTREKCPIHVARHEAGHAVIAHVLGHEVRRIRVYRSKGKWRGYVLDRAPGRRSDPLRVGIIYLAGWAAEREFNPRARRLPYEGEGDVLMIKRMGFRGSSCATLACHARGMVREHREAIAALAAEVQRRDLMAHHVRDLLSGVPVID